jgi:hypothetical protein
MFYMLLIGLTSSSHFELLDDHICLGILPIKVVVIAQLTGKGLWTYGLCVIAGMNAFFSLTLL